MTTLSESIGDFAFIDFETRALPGTDEKDGNVQSAGTHRYARHSFPIILTFAIGDEPVQCVSVADFNTRMLIPPPLQAFWERAAKGEAWFVAWKTSFDRAIWNAHFPRIRPEMAIDAMCQALASNLPADLHSASQALGGPGKQADGSKLIRLFSPADGATPETHPQEWERFKSYAVQDTMILRDIFRATRPLPVSEWEEYWTSEKINERGGAIDGAFCEKAAALAEASSGWSNHQLIGLTGTKHIRITTPQRIAHWAYETLEDPEMWSILETEVDEDESEEENGETVVESNDKRPKLRLSRAHIVRIRNLLALKRQRKGLSDDEQRVDQVLELREYGGASSISKFSRMVNQHDDGRLKDSYVFNGAMQTGRFSSRGVQIHNLPRESLGALEETAIADILEMEGHPFFDRHVDRFAKQYGSPGKALSRLIRPSLVAAPGKTLVWADWSNIEARVNPWLSGSKYGDAKLDVFRDTDARDDGLDVYHFTAAALLGCDPGMVTKAQRQSHGKVPELSLGFGGGKDALLRMATAYNVLLSDDMAQEMVKHWREANPWARQFWETLWSAVTRAMEHPDLIYEAGRVAYVFKPDYLGGSLFCALPNGRLLTYPQCRWEDAEVEDKKTGEKQIRQQLTYRKGHGRASLWYGKLCENVTQASAGSLLRDKLYMLEECQGGRLPVVIHTHDDICIEVEEERAEEAARALVRIMTEPEEWCEELPLAAKATTKWYFTKADD